MTYKAARDAILDALERQGWKVQRQLKVPHATGPYGHPRLWFKAQSIYSDPNPPFSFSNARSLFLDMRNLAFLARNDPSRLSEILVEAGMRPTVRWTPSQNPGPNPTTRAVVHGAVVTILSSLGLFGLWMGHETLQRAANGRAPR